MADRSSEIFKETARNIAKALFDVLNGTEGYVRSDVVKLEQGSVVATVNNIFQDTDVNETQIQDKIKNATTSSGLLNGATFATVSLCEVEPFPCQERSTTCKSASGSASCTCEDGYISTPYSNKSCIACPSGQKAVNNECKLCPFGYSGFNCNDSSLLAVVVVSCVLGGILLIMVLTSLIYRLWKGPSKGKPDYGGSPYSSGNGSQPVPTGFKRFPRATTKWDDDPAIEMTEGNRPNVLMDKTPQTNGWRGSYDFKPDAMMTFKGKNPSQYSYLVQGHVNPYYLPGDEKNN